MSRLLLLVVIINVSAIRSLAADEVITVNVLPDTKNVSETCNAQNCITFSNCSSEPEQCFQSDTSLLFQPKEYHLEEPIVVRDIHNLSLCVINCTQSHYVATIHCQSTAGFAFVNISFFRIQNINLISCGFPINKTELATRATFLHGQVYLTNSLSAALQIMLSFQSAIDNVNITNSKGNGIFWVNPLGRSTEYDAVWSLRKNNRDILDGLTINTSRFFMSEWVPQRVLLENDRIAMFIGHGGMGGVTESLRNSLPVIVIPFNSDQWDTAARIKAQGLGIVLNRNYLTSSDITVAVEALKSAKYVQMAKKMSKIFHFAGGTKKAADLVEYYVDVGYEHLVPATSEHQWNWLEFYNIEADVYALTLLGLLIFVCCCLKIYLSFVAR